MFLRAYVAHPGKWTEMIADMKGNLHQMNDVTREYYGTASTRQLRDRISTKIHALMAKPRQDIVNAHIR